MTRPWFERYVGLPFADGGRAWQGVDCWGLVYLVFKYEKGIDLPTYGEIAAHELVKIAYKVAEETAKEPWHPAVRPQAFDMAVMYRKHAPIHVGVMADSQRVLHIEPATSAVLIEVSHPSVKFRSIGYFRHTEMLNVAA